MYSARTRYDSQLDSLEWSITRRRIIKRAQGHCEYCKRPADRFEVHHEEYHGNHPSDTPDNLLMAVHPGCHDDIHWRERLAQYSKRKNELIEQGASSFELDRLVKGYGV